MTNRERFNRVLNLEPVDRLPVLEWAGWWDKTLTRWYAEGLPAGLTDAGDIRECDLEVLVGCQYGPRFTECPYLAGAAGPTRRTVCE